MKKLTSLMLVAFALMLQMSFATQVQLTVRLKNGDVVTGKSNLPKITVVTPYGSLSIPIEKVNTLKFGVPSDPTKTPAVLTDLKKLQTATPAESKVVYERLLGYGTPILAAVVAFTQDANYKVSDNEEYTIEQLLEALYAKAGVTSADNVNDAVTYDGLNYVEGAIAFTDINVQSEYGNLLFRRDKIESMDVSVIEEVTAGTDGSFKLKANYHISGNDSKGWVNTGVKVKPGDKFTITASGKIILKSLSGGAYNPDGYVSGTKDAAYTDDMSPKYGAVVYRIGEWGSVLQAGTKFVGEATEEGMIYISIYETVFDKTNSGTYSVKVVKK